MGAKSSGGVGSRSSSNIVMEEDPIQICLYLPLVDKEAKRVLCLYFGTRSSSCRATPLPPAKTTYHSITPFFY
jgi:hypothetical protein